MNSQKCTPTTPAERAQLAGCEIALSTLQAMKGERTEERRAALLLSSLEQLSEQCNHRYDAMEGFAWVLARVLGQRLGGRS